MESLNVIKIIFSILSLTMIILSGLINTLEKYLPVFITRSFRYGKFSYNGSKNNPLVSVEVPKSWFKHFYVFSSISVSIAMYFVVKSYIYNIEVPILIKEILDIVAIDRTESVSAFSTFLALILLTIQCYHRYYDTHFVSIFGSKSKMNLIHYIAGFIHYAGAILAILAEAPNFQTSLTPNVVLNLNNFSLLDILAAALFLWACWHQFVVTDILANLRKDVKGRVVSEKHFLPRGDWFEYVSSPHSLAEILMYLSLTIILRANSTWRYVFVWVLTNQVETSLLSHWWYKETFKNCPRQRKAIVPFLL